MKSSSQRIFTMLLIGLLLAIAALRIDGGIDRQSTDLTVSARCTYTTQGFPLKVTEQPTPSNGEICPSEQPLEPLNMGFNSLFYSAVLLLGSVLVRPPVWMKQNSAVRLVGYSASLVGLAFAGLFGWGMSVVLLGV